MAPAEFFHGPFVFRISIQVSHVSSPVRYPILQRSNWQNWPRPKRRRFRSHIYHHTYMVCRSLYAAIANYIPARSSRTWILPYHPEEYLLRAAWGHGQAHGSCSGHMRLGGSPGLLCPNRCALEQVYRGRTAPRFSRPSNSASIWLRRTCLVRARNLYGLAFSTLFPNTVCSTSVIQE